MSVACQAEEAGPGSDDEGHHRKGSQFKTHLKKNEAASEFSKTKTIAQQRRSLPVYQVKDELLQVGSGGGELILIFLSIDFLFYCRYHILLVFDSSCLICKIFHVLPRVG